MGYGRGKRERGTEKKSPISCDLVSLVPGALASHTAQLESQSRQLTGSMLRATGASIMPAFEPHMPLERQEVFLIARNLHLMLISCLATDRFM